MPGLDNYSRYQEKDTPPPSPKQKILSTKKEVLADLNRNTGLTAHMWHENITAFCENNFFIEKNHGLIPFTPSELLIIMNHDKNIGAFRFLKLLKKLFKRYKVLNKDKIILDIYLSYSNEDISHDDKIRVIQEFFKELSDKKSLNKVASKAVNPAKFKKLFKEYQSENFEKRMDKYEKKHKAKNVLKSSLPILERFKY